MRSARTNEALKRLHRLVALVMHERGLSHTLSTFSLPTYGSDCGVASKQAADEPALCSGRAPHVPKPWTTYTVLDGSAMFQLPCSKHTLNLRVLVARSLRSGYVGHGRLGDLPSMTVASDCPALESVSRKDSTWSTLDYVKRDSMLPSRFECYKALVVDFCRSFVTRTVATFGADMWATSD